MRTSGGRDGAAAAGARAARGWAIAGAVALGACHRDRPARPADSVTPETSAAEPAPPATPTAAASRWDPAAGSALLVRGDGGEAFVVVPGEGGDAATDRTSGAATDVLPGDVALFSRAGAAGQAKAVPTDAASPSGCTWPAARLGPASGADAVPAWTVGFVGVSPAPTPIALDSIEGAGAADSATLAATVTRLAAGLPDDTVRTFHGVPFTVTTARRFTIGDGGAARDAVVATITRSLNQEAAPLSERVLLVAERPHAVAGASTPPAPWTVVYHERVAGREDVVPATDVLAAVRLGGTAPDPRTTLVLARALADGTRYTLLERTGDGWRVRWTSATRGC